MLSSSSLCPLLPTLSAPWRRQTAARAKQTRLIGTQTPLIKCWLCLGCFVIIRAVFINRGSHSNFLADSCHSLRRLRECQRITPFGMRWRADRPRCVPYGTVVLTYLVVGDRLESSVAADVRQ